MTIMQVGIVACLGMKKAPGRSAVKPRKDLPETVSPGGAVYVQGQKGHFREKICRKQFLPEGLFTCKDKKVIFTV